jgi:hypothetical protein
MAVALAALQGVLLNVLPQAMFRRISPIIQMAALTVLLTLFLVYPLIGAAFLILLERSSELLFYFPIFWFVGLYGSQLSVGLNSPVLAALGRQAILGLLVAAGVFAASYALAYRRHARSVLDGADFKPRGSDTDETRLRLRGLYSRILRHPTQRACFGFIGSILTRSPRHQVFLAVYLAIGFSLGLSTLCRVDRTAAFPFQILDDGMLALPLILSFFVISGLRATFNIPHELSANWLFQLTNSGSPAEYFAATEKFVRFWGVIPFLLFSAILEFSYWTWSEAVFHLFFEGIVSLVLVHVLFSGFRKVPFTCSYFPGKKNLALLGIFYIYGFTAYSSTMVALEHWLMESAFRAVVFAIGGIALLAVLFQRRHKAAPLIYEERSNTELQELGLH